jgi:hypothetical protein
MLDELLLLLLAAVGATVVWLGLGFSPSLCVVWLPASARPL